SCSSPYLVHLHLHFSPPSHSFPPLPLPPSPFFFFLSPRRPPTSTLFPYTTLFRSLRRPQRTGDECRNGDPDRAHRRFRRRHRPRSEEHTSELQSRFDLVCRLLLEKKKKKKSHIIHMLERWPKLPARERIPKHEVRS